MFKNFIIILLFFLLCSLLIQKPDNAKLLIQDLATSKEMVIDGADYIHKTFDTEFSVHSDEVFEKEHGEKIEGSKNMFDKSDYSPNQMFNNDKIVEETWYNEK